MNRPGICEAPTFLADVPSADAPFDRIICFAYSFGGYAEAGGIEQCAYIANERRHNTLTELRACLFFEQRRAYHTGEDANDKEEAYQRSLITQICDKVLAGERT